MKTQKLLYIVSFILILSVSCTDKFLDIQPSSQLPGDGFYESETDAKAGVYGAYNAAQSAFRYYFAFWGEGRADAVKTAHPGDPNLLITNNLSITLSSADWSGLYLIISRANYAIKYIPEIFEEGDEEGLQLLGQAHALRALAYFYCARVWGDVPLITEPYVSADQEVFTTMTDKEKILDQVEEDLTFAAINCEDELGTDSRVLFVKGSAYALLTQVYMWRHKYTEALETSQKVLDNNLYSLVPLSEWSTIFTKGSSVESIFEIGYDESRTNNLRILYAIGGDSDYMPSDVFRNSFENGDQRQTLIYDITKAEPKAIWKFFGEGFDDEDASLSTNNIVLIRLADIMLLRAEALNEQGSSSDALALLNTIRERAGLTALTLNDANTMYGDLESAILHERSIELCYEGHRWFDLVRTGKAISTMGPINGLSDNGNLVWPIGETSMNENPNLIQNSFYQ